MDSNNPLNLDLIVPLHIPVFILNENYMIVIFEILIKRLINIKNYFYSI
jgi:hypothetical protein